MSHRLLVCTAMVLAAAPLLAWGTDAATITRQGNGNGAAPCMACHGADGAGQAAAGNPRLAGLDAGYLQKQLDDFANGARNSPVMKPTATALDDSERHALALYYSKLPLPASLARPGTPMPAADSVGALLATRGDWGRDIPGCVQCHGPGGTGVGAHFPPLAGQSASYLEAQLQAWRNGSRHNDPLQLMQHLSKALSVQEIDAVAAWFAAQPLPASGAKP